MSELSFVPFDQVSATFEQVLAASVADETELVWFERKYGAVGTDEQSPCFLQAPRLTILIRVVECGRQGWHRTDVCHPSELESGLRQALALAKMQPTAKKRPVLPTDKRELRFAPKLLDPELSRLDVSAARAMVAKWCDKDLTGRLNWSETRIGVFNSHGMRRSAATSELSLEVERNSRFGRSRAAGSARSLKALAADTICERVRRSPASARADLPAGPMPILLAPEAMIVLLNVLNTFALAGRAYLDGSSFLVRHRNVQVFDRTFNLCDDGQRLPGLPFPFDLEGSAKKPIDLIVDGQPSTVALNHYQGSETGMRPTAQAVGGQDALFGNLFMLPGETSPDDLLAAAEGGIFVGWLDPPECLEPQQLRIRTVARCVRRIENGQLGPFLPDFVWEESLLRALARLRAVGNQVVVHAMPTTPLGAMSAPAVVLADAEGFVTVC